MHPCLLEVMDQLSVVWKCSNLKEKQLSSSVNIMQLFEQLEVTGRYAAIPEITWDAEGHEATVMIGGVWRYYS